MKRLGVLMVNELEFKVERIWLENGELHLWCGRPGPIEAFTTDFGVLFGPDGVEVVRGNTLMEVPAAGVGDWTFIDWPMSFIDKEGWSDSMKPEEVPFP